MFLHLLLSSLGAGRLTHLCFLGLGSHEEPHRRLGSGFHAPTQTLFLPTCTQAFATPSTRSRRPTLFPSPPSLLSVKPLVRALPLAAPPGPSLLAPQDLPTSRGPLPSPHPGILPAGQSWRASLVSQPPLLSPRFPAPPWAPPTPQEPRTQRWGYCSLGSLCRAPVSHDQTWGQEGKRKREQQGFWGALERKGESAKEIDCPDRVPLARLPGGSERPPPEGGKGSKKGRVSLWASRVFGVGPSQRMQL